MPVTAVKPTLSFRSPLVPTKSSQHNPPLSTPRHLQDLYLPPLFPAKTPAKAQPEFYTNIAQRVAFFEATEHCIGATTSITPRIVDHRKLSEIRKKSNNAAVNRLIDEVQKRRKSRLRFTRTYHKDPIYQRVAATISTDGSAKLLVARYHRQSLSPAQFTLLCEKELFGKASKLGKDFPKGIQYQLFDLDTPDVRAALEENLFCSSPRHAHFIQKFEPLFWDKDKRAKVIGTELKKELSSEDSDK